MLHTLLKKTAEEGSCVSLTAGFLYIATLFTFPLTDNALYDEQESEEPFRVFNLTACRSSGPVLWCM